MVSPISAVWDLIRLPSHLVLISYAMDWCRFAKNKGSEGMAKEVAKRRSSAPVLSSGPSKTSQETKLPSETTVVKGGFPSLRIITPK